MHISSNNCTDRVKTIQNSSKHVTVDFDVRGQQRMDFFTGRSIMDCGL